MASTSRYANNRVRRRRALRRLTGRGGRVPPGVLRAINADARRDKGGGRRLLMAGGAATFLGSLSAGTIATILLGIVLFGGSAYGGYLYFSRNLPDVNQFEAKPFGTTRIYDRNGRLLQEVSDPDLGWRTNVQLDQIAPRVLEATLAAE